MCWQAEQASADADADVDTDADAEAEPEAEAEAEADSDADAVLESGNHSMHDRRSPGPPGACHPNPESNPAVPPMTAALPSPWDKATSQRLRLLSNQANTACTTGSPLANPAHAIQTPNQILPYPP